MPSPKAHNYATRLFFGKPYSEVHKALDRAYIFAGRNHRRFFHTPIEAFTMESIASLDGKGGAVGLFHVWLDKECPRNREFKAWVEFSARQDMIWQKQMRMWTKLIKRHR